MVRAFPLSAFACRELSTREGRVTNAVFLVHFEIPTFKEMIRELSPSFLSAGRTSSSLLLSLEPAGSDRK
jgi:hypothetical protein